MANSESTAACAHNHIVHGKHQGASGTVYGDYWRCDGCGTYFCRRPLSPMKLAIKGGFICDPDPKLPVSTAEAAPDLQDSCVCENFANPNCPVCFPVAKVGSWCGEST